jgi:hypothetical protein
MGEEIVSEAQNTPEPSAPQQAESDNLGPSQQDNSMINMVYTGESVLSFRTLLKRYNLWRRESLCRNVAGANFAHTFDMNFAAYPFLRGNVAGAIDSSTAGVYNFVNTVLMHWVTYSFQGFRGSIRYKALANMTATNSFLQGNITVQRKPLGDTLYEKNSANITAFLYDSAAAASVVLDYAAPVTRINTGVRGLLYTNLDINSASEFEIPYYSQDRFVPGKVQDWTDTPQRVEGYKLKCNAIVSDKSVLDLYVAAGEDFQVYMWTGLPRMYCESTPPLPVEPG